MLTQGPTSSPGDGASGRHATFPRSEGTSSWKHGPTKLHGEIKPRRQARLSEPPRCFPVFPACRQCTQRFPKSEWGTVGGNIHSKGRHGIVLPIGRAECSLLVAAKRLAALMKGWPGIHTPTEPPFVLRAEAGSAAGRASTQVIRGNAKPQESAKILRLLSPGLQRNGNLGQ